MARGEMVAMLAELQAATVAAPAARPPLVRELPADLDTPISAYLKLGGDGPSFLLESVEGGERVARYSFIGAAPRAQYRLLAGEVEVVEPAGGRRGPAGAGRGPAG